MQPSIHYNDAWESIPLEYSDDFIAFFDNKLQPTHPLRAYNLFPIAKCWRKERYLVEELESSDYLWILDFEKKKRYQGKTYYYFKNMETQGELNSLLQADYENWVQYMKDAEAWEE